MHTKITRRKLLQHALWSTAGYSAAGFGADRRTSKRVVISGWGGTAQRAMRLAFFDPFTRATGIEVEEHVYGSSGLARLKAQLSHGTPQIDLLDGPAFWPAIGLAQGLLEKIELRLPHADFVAGAIEDYSFGYSSVSFGITRLLRRRTRPRSWSDFWNVEKYPGRRAFFGPVAARHPEYALMADGLPTTEVYPLTAEKLEIAFRKLREIKPHINVWYQTPAQCEQMLLEQQIDFVEFFSGRAFSLRDRGLPLEFEWNQAILNMSVFVLAKNAPNAENALRFLEFIAQSEPQAHFARLINYGPTNLKAIDLIEDPVILQRLPTYEPNLARQLALDSQWWSANHSPLSARWSQLLAS